MTKPPAVRKNTFTVRVTDDKVLDQLEALDKLFPTQNALFNAALTIGLPALSGKSVTGAAKADAGLARILKQIELTGEDTFVLLSVIESMVAALLNAKHMELSGEPVGAEDMYNGRLSVLPPQLEEVKATVISGFEWHKKREDKA
jgi:hypothetical protein